MAEGERAGRHQFTSGMHMGLAMRGRCIGCVSVPPAVRPYCGARRGLAPIARSLSASGEALHRSSDNQLPLDRQNVSVSDSVRKR